mgnify:CR=1 FL=1
MNEKVTILDRKEIEILGATRVIASTAKEAVIEIEGGIMTVAGNNLEVTKLDLDNREVKFSGQINNVKFSDKREKVGLLKRIFK